MLRRSNPTTGSARGDGRSGEAIDRDRSLVEAARRDPAAFGALYRRYLAQVYSFALYELRDPHAAEDVTERTFLAALTHLDRFEERGDLVAGSETSTFRAWLFQIARNAIANQRRTDRRRHVAPLTEAAGLDDGRDVERDVLAREAASAAWSAVRRLPEDRRRAVVLRFVDGLTTAEMARVLNRSEGAVRVLLHRALRSLSAELGGRRS